MSMLGWIIFGMGAVLVSLFGWLIGLVLTLGVTNQETVNSLQSNGGGCLLPLIGVIGGVYARANILDNSWMVLGWVGGIYLAIGVIVGLGTRLLIVPIFGPHTVTKPIYKNPSVIFWVLPLLLCGVWLIRQPQCIIKPGADLRGCDFSGQDLRMADLRDADLREADLTGANLANADLTGADLNGAVLINAEMGQAILEGANLTQADLAGADLTEARVSRANIEGVDPKMLVGAYHGGSFLSEETQLRLRAVCDGQGIPQAAAYDSAPGLHQLGMVVKLSDDMPWWLGELPPHWLAPTLESVELVICVKYTSHLIETCEYELGSEVERVANAISIVLREARTGNAVGRMNAQGKPRGCPSILTVDGIQTHTWYGDVEEQTVTDWLAQYIEPSE